MVSEEPSARPGTEDVTLGRRVVAFLVDVVVLALVGAIPAVAVATPWSGAPRNPGTYVLYVLLFVTYFTYLEGSTGQTIGKRLVGIVVVDLEGDPIGYREALVRTLLRVVDFLPTLYIVGLVLILVTDRWQRLGDIAAGTVVVRTG
jgi:uncharacterized RDD family membrane protein YckC